MNRRSASLFSLASFVLFVPGLFGLAAAGCNFIVGVGDYAVGTAGDGSADSTGGGGDDGSGGGQDSASESSSTGDDGPAGGGDSADGGGGGADTGTTQDAEMDVRMRADVAVDATPFEGGVDPCMPDTTVACSSGNGAGYTCQGTHSPEESHLAWVCGSSVSMTSTTSSYCCWTCNADTTVTGCPLHQTTQSCDGTDTPKQDYGDNCVATSSNGAGAHGFCCNPVPAITSCTTYDGCTGYSKYAVCTRSGHCTLATGLTGDPCTTGTDCGSGLTCNGKWCRPTTCTSDSSCGTATSGLANQCASTSSGNICFASCAAFYDCDSYDGTLYGTFCVAGGDSTTLGVCSATSGGVGDPCNSSSDCTGSLTCGNSYSCTQTCSGTGDTSCGSNALGVANHCVYDSFDGVYECIPGCSTSRDCLAYYNTSCTSSSCQ